LLSQASTEDLRFAELEDFVENSVVPLHRVGTDGTILWANRAEMDFLGYSPAEYIGQHISQFHADQTALQDILDRLCRREELRGYSARLRRKDGSVRDVRIYSNAFAPDGVFLHTRCFTLDVTELKEGEDARARLAAIVESSEDAIISKDLNGIITSWNAAAERIFGYSAHEIVGKSVLTLIPQALHNEEPMILGKLRRGERIDHYETQRIRKDGQVLQVSLSISPVRDANGVIIAASKIARDITRLKMEEQTLRNAERLASMGKLAATVSHEINNPLEAVVNLVHLAKTGCQTEPEKTEQYLALAEQELARVCHLTKQTLGFYRGGNHPVATNISPHLEHLLAVYAPKLNNKGIKAEVELRDDSEVIAIPLELQQVLTNLISNSIDASTSNGIIRFRVSRSCLRKKHVPAVRITIADSGPGIPPPVRKKLFEPFFTTKKDTGTGLGLWVCKGIVEKLGGMIQVCTRTTPGNSGTVVSLLLPAA
jgi:PAS domain S-box-containing protein